MRRYGASVQNAARCSIVAISPPTSYVCTRCGYHFRMHAFDRIASIVDGEFTEIGRDVEPSDPLGWTDKKTYPAKLDGDREKSGLSESVVCGFAARSAAFHVGLGVMDFHFRGGTMGRVDGRTDHAAVRGGPRA